MASLSRPIFLIIFTLFYGSATAEEAETPPVANPTATDQVLESNPPSLINMTALPSSIVNGSVNVVTGDYLIADVDYTVSAPDPYVLGHSYSSSSLEPGSLGRGWNFHHHHLLEVFQTGKITFREREPECGEGDMFLYLIEPMGGRIAFTVACEDDHEIPKLKHFDVITKNTGFTNVFGGEISGQTNIKNIDVKFDRHHNVFTVKLGDGTVRSYERMWKSHEIKNDCPNHVKHYRDYQLEEEILPSGNIFKYHYDNNYQVSKIICSNSDKAEISKIDFEHKDHSIKVKNSDKQEITYDLKEVKGHSKRGKYTISAIHKPGFPSTHFKYSQKSDNYDRRVKRVKRDDGYYVETKYYRNAPNKVGKRLVEPDTKKERHFLQNRVRFQRAPVGPDNKEIITHRYFYHKKEGSKAGRCSVHDANNNITRYYWNGSRRLVAIKKETPDRKLLMKETFVWGTGKEQGYLLARNLFDEEDKPKLSRVFEYDHRGNVKAEILYGKFTRDTGELKLDNDGLPHHSTCDKLETYYTYSDDGFNLKLSECDPLGNYTHYDYHKGSNLLKSKLICEGEEIKKREFYSYDKNALVIEEISDDGTSDDKHSLKGVTERHIKRITPRYERPHFGEPEVIEEYCLKKGKERLLSQTVNSYDDYGFLSKKKVYDADKKLASTTKYEHDKAGRLLYTKDALGREEFYTYDKSGRLKTKRGPREDLLIRYEYDLAGRLKKETEEHKDGPILSTSYEYDLLGRKVAVTNPQSQTTRYEYDALDRITKISYPTIFDHEGKAITPTKTYTYKKLGTTVVESDEKDHKTTTVYNAAGKVFARTLADGTKWSYRYDKKGNPIREETPNLARNYMRYDHFGRLTKTSMHKGGNRLSLKKCFYNTFHLIKEISPTREVTFYRYDSAGRKSAEIVGKAASDQRLTTYTYDSLSRLSQARSYYGKDKSEFIATAYAYDALNRKVSESTIDGQGKIHTHKTFGYDQEGNVAEVAESVMGQTAITKSLYYPHGVLKEQTDALGNTWKYFYDYNYANVHGQSVIKKTVVDPRGVTLHEVYDTRGNLSFVTTTDPFGNSLAKQELYYDAANNLIRTHDHSITEAKTEKLVINACAYGPLNRIEQIIEALGTPEQKTTCYIYNDLGQKEKILHADGTILHHTYDEKGRLKEYFAEDKSLHYEYSYDASDRVLAVTNHLTGKKTARSYDAFGELVSETLESDLTTHYAYDKAGRLAALTLPDSSTVQYGYSPAFLQSVTRTDATNQPAWKYEITSRDLSGHILSAVLPKNAGSISYGYDLLGRRTETSHPSFSEQALKFDAVGNLLHLKRDGEDSHYSYDLLSQLTSETGKATHAYSYDSLYNRRSLDDKAYEVNSLHSVLSDGRKSFSYDQRGNRLQSDNTKYRYDALDRLIDVEIDDKRYVYSYDAMDRRIQKEIFSKTSDGWKSEHVEKYIYHLQNEIGSCDIYGTIKELRILGEGLGAEIGATIALELQNKLFVSLNDRRGNITALLDPDTAQVVESYQYDAFGNEVCENRITSNPWSFCSKRVDAETGFVYFGRRYYDPSLGKWITHDPLGLKAGPNLYAYVLNNPLTKIDLYGLLEQDEHPQNSSSDTERTSATDSASGSDRTHDSIASRVMEGLRELLREEMRGDFLFDALERIEMENQAQGTFNQQSGLNPLSSTLPKEDVDDAKAGQDWSLSNMLRDWFFDRIIDYALNRVGSKSKFNSKRPGCKGGPKHKEKVNQRIKELESKEHQHLKGGTEKEERIDTPRGSKEYRRPDITTKRPDGTLYRENVGKTTKSGEPIARERQALDDMETVLGERPGYTPYDR